MYPWRGRVVYTYFSQGCRIKMWMATVNALDPGRTGPWPGFHALEVPALALLLPCLPWWGTESRVPETQPHSGHWNSLTEWELHGLFSVLPPNGRLGHLCPHPMHKGQQFADIGQNGDTQTGVAINTAWGPLSCREELGMWREVGPVTQCLAWVLLIRRVSVKLWKSTSVTCIEITTFVENQRTG